MLRMKVAFIADLHLANHRRFGKPSRGTVAPINTRAADIISVLRQARKAAEERGCSDLYILGDVFDTVTPEPQLIAELSAALATQRSDLLVHILVGNHDQVSDQPGDHALIALDGCRNVTVYEKPTIAYPQTGDANIWMIPYRPGHAVEYLPGVIKELGAEHMKKGAQVLALHLGLRAERTEAWLASSHDSYPAADIKTQCGEFDTVFAGNWHGRYEVLPGVWQIGALVPTGFDNPGWDEYGSLLITDGRQVMPVTIPGPRFIKAVGFKEVREVLNEVAKRETGYPAYVSARVALDERDKVRDLFDAYGHEHYEILNNKEILEDAARVAAFHTAYASADGVQSAIKAYVQRMAIPDGISRDLVVAQALDYVAGASHG